LSNHWQLKNDGTDKEHAHQRDFIRWFRREYPDKLIHATPNAGKRTAANAASLKAEGMVTGWPDMSVDPDPLHIEMKIPSERNRKNGGCSPAQLKVHDDLRRVGCTVLVTYGSEDAQKQVKEYFVG
jgi:hypothetical protein